MWKLCSSKISAAIFLLNITVDNCKSVPSWQHWLFSMTSFMTHIHDTIFPSIHLDIHRKWRNLVLHLFVLATYATYAWAENSFYSYDKNYFILWVWRVSSKSVLTLTEKLHFLTTCIKMSIWSCLDQSFVRLLEVWKGIF